MALLTEYVRSAVASSSRPRAPSLRGARSPAAAWAAASAVSAPRFRRPRCCWRPRRQPRLPPQGPTRSGRRVRPPFLAYHGSRQAPGSPPSGHSAAMPAWARAPSWAWRWPGPWPSCTGCRPIRSSWPGRSPEASGRRSGPGPSPWRVHRGGRAAAGSGGVAPLLARFASPRAGAAWSRCRRGPGLSGEAEATAFEQLPAPPEREAERVAHLVLMQLLPALVEADLAELWDPLVGGAAHHGRLVCGPAGRRLRPGTHGRLVADMARGVPPAWARAPGAGGVRPGGGRRQPG